MISIVGLGNIGMNILQTFAQKGIAAVGVETNPASVERYMKRSASNLKRLVSKGKLSPEQKTAVLENMHITDDLEQIRASEAVIETIYEDIDAKIALFQKIDGVVDRRCLMLSNTSSLSITKMASTVSSPERFAGMHFFNPVPVMRLVEIVRGLQTSQATVDAVARLAAELGKEWIVSADKPAFVVNRMLNALVKEAVMLLEEGVASAEDIDKGARLGLGHPLGPLELFDYLNAVHLLDRVLQHMADELDPRFRPPVLLKNLTRAGWWGEQYGRGFYNHLK